MAENTNRKGIRIVLIVIETIGLLAFLGTLPVFNSGNIAGLAVMAFFLLVTIFWN